MSELGDERVQPALQAMLAEDAIGLQRALDADPGIVHQSWSGNSLLEWMTQPPHQISVEIVSVLIGAGSPLDRALNLAGCWNLDALCTQLLAAGANPAARADAGITPLESAALHGSTKSADVLVAHGLHRPSLWLAAASGQMDRVREWVSPNGDVRRDPGPYRPDLADVGHPPGPQPGDSSAEFIAEALAFAGANNRMAVVDYFADGGADINAGIYWNTTALHLAIMFRAADAVSGLLERGADPTRRDDGRHGDAAGWARACLDDTLASHRIAEMLGVT